jgi:hypothetical protein
MYDFVLRVLDRVLNILLAFKVGRDSQQAEEAKVVLNIIQDSKETEKTVKEMTEDELWEAIIGKSASD